MISLSLTDKGADNLRKKLDFEARGINFNKIKFILHLKTNIAFKAKQDLVLGDYEIQIKEYDINSISTHRVLCEIVCAELKEKKEDMILNEAIDKIEKIFTLLDSPFEILSEYETYYFYEETNEWITKFDLNMSMTFMQVHEKFPQDIVDLLKKLTLISKKNIKIFNSILEMIDIYKFGLNHFDKFKRDSFLYFYLILERMADHLPSNLYVIDKIDDLVFSEISRFSLKGSQKNKMYMLYIFMERDFSIDAVMELADIRNNLAHGKQVIDTEKLKFCRDFSFQCLKRYIDLNS